jgi:hypothetical protein
MSSGKIRWRHLVCKAHSFNDDIEPPETLHFAMEMFWFCYMYIGKYYGFLQLKGPRKLGRATEVRMLITI